MPPPMPPSLLGVVPSAAPSFAKERPPDDDAIWQDIARKTGRLTDGAEEVLAEVKAVAAKRQKTG